MDGGEYASSRGPGAPTPARVSLAHLVSPSPRRLSGCFEEPSRPALKKIAWVSLQGRLVGAEEATSAGAIGGGLSGDEAVAWDLFSPLHRVLVVAVVAAAAYNSKRARQIEQFQRSVELRDEVLLSMQQKLDNLCEQMNSLQDQPVKCISGLSLENDQFNAEVKQLQVASQFCGSRTSLLELNPESGSLPLCRHVSSGLHGGKDATGIESAKGEAFNADNLIPTEQEERRMSDLSDFNWSVTSSVDFQLSALASEQEFYNLRKECEEKDAKIKELAIAVDAFRAADCKRITELEEIIRRKNLVISKLKKDKAVLEKQVVELTRLRRSSSTALDTSNLQPPVMANNILYDMSSTSPSSSDPDSPMTSKQYHSQRSVAEDNPQRHDIRMAEIISPSSVEHLIPLNKSNDGSLKQQFISPLKENQRIQRSEPASALRHRRIVHFSEDSKRTRRAAHQKANYTSSKMRWT
ncbi:uncharacterized protein LOC135648756 [Musa acuminata AAA Group]|uniref:uncharacterized protein LOC135648756 n=1 Tax=Musa acuminata AAA Group TaxID=214697 RepID=UPI0031D9BA78